MTSVMTMSFLLDADDVCACCKEKIYEEKYVVPYVSLVFTLSAVNQKQKSLALPTSWHIRERRLPRISFGFVTHVYVNSVKLAKKKWMNQIGY